MLILSSQLSLKSSQTRWRWRLLRGKGLSRSATTASKMVKRPQSFLLVGKALVLASITPRACIKSGFLLVNQSFKFSSKDSGKLKWTLTASMPTQAQFLSTMVFLGSPNGFNNASYLSWLLPIITRRQSSFSKTNLTSVGCQNHLCSSSRRCFQQLISKERS